MPQNQGHEIASELQELADHIMIAKNLNHTAIWALLEDLSKRTKLFADIFEQVLSKGDPNAGS